MPAADFPLTGQLWPEAGSYTAGNTRNIFNKSFPH